MKRLNEEISLKLLGTVVGDVNITRIAKLTGIAVKEKWNAEIVAPIAKIFGHVTKDLPLKIKLMKMSKSVHLKIQMIKQQMKQTKQSSNIKYLFLILSFILVSALPDYASLTLQGPSGYVQVPSAKTIKAKEVELAVHTQMYRVSNSSKDSSLTSLAFGFSPFRDFEVGVQKNIDSDNTALDPDPTVNFKVRLPAVGQGEFSEAAFGMLLDTNPNNYHTMYLTVGGFGIGWNFGGNPGYGTASYGSYNRDKKEPNPICLLVGTEYPRPHPGERGYRSHYYLDYNGDVCSLGWRYKSQRGFSIDAAVHSKSSYTDFYDYRPLIIGFGAEF